MTARANLKTYLAISVVLLGVGRTTATEQIFVDADVTGPEIRQDYAPDEIIVKFKNNAAITLEEKILAGSDAAQLELSGSLDKLNKKFRLRNVKPLFKNFKARRRRLNALPKKDKALLTKREKRILRRLKRSGEKTAVPALDRIYKLQLDLKPNQSIQQVLAAYNNDPSVEYAERNYIVSICKTPDDPLYPLQWPLNNTGQDYPESGYYNPPPGTPDCDIDAPEAWDMNTGSSKVIVAVIDTGVDYNHRDLQDNIWVNQTELNGVADVDDDDNGYIDDIYGYDFSNHDSDPIDDHGHGTHCSGIIAARGNNGLDIAGVCWNAKIMALKFLNAAGQGFTSDAVTAFYYAVENGADVVSNSWGGGGYSEALKEAIDYAHSQGVIMVAAAGNNDSNSPHYPAYYEHVTAVAATNSNDAKPSFSNYGNWVDIAAPGVDILSLRASGTSGGTPYDSYTTIATGTSMACPHVAGSFAVLLSTKPFMTCDEALEVLMETTDPISPEICLSGRLNLFNAMAAIVSPKGVVVLDNDLYSCSDELTIWLADSDLKEQGSQQVTLTTDSGDSETVLLTEGAPAAGVFTGTIPTASGAANIEDGTLQLLHGEIITAAYQDEDDGTGNPAAAADTALAHCESPEIFNVQIDVPGPEPTVTFETNEPSTTRVRCGLVCGGPYIIEGSTPILATSHTIKLIGVFPKTDYFFIIEATDVLGNETVDDNAGTCFAFTTDDGPRDIYVPGQYSTIQEAIYRSWNGGTVLVADGTYTGEGNRDLDFGGKAITVRSENGPENCIIDCNGTEAESHRGFYFHSGEDANSVLAGFTITNGYVSGSWYVGIGGGICCDNSSPTIANCIITGNSAGWDGGGINNINSSPTITNCTFTSNSAIGNDGGGINNERSSPIINNCTFSGNSAYDWGGAIRNVFFCSPTITNCTFSGNSADDGGAMFYYYGCTPTITNCTFAGNSARNGNALACDSRYQLSPSNLRLSNCILRNGGNEIWNNDGSTITITYSDVQSGWPGETNIDADPCFVGPGVDDLRLLPASPCIDAGDNTAVPPDTLDLDGDGDTTEPIPFDLAGHLRFVDRADVPDTGNGTAPIVDMGAYEANYIEVAMKFTPQALNLGSKGKWVKAHFVLPEEFGVEDVNTNTPAVIALLGIKSDHINVFINEDGLVEIEAAFSRSDFCALATSDDGTEVIVIGLLNSGRNFYGRDTIRIITKSLEYIAVLASHWLEGGCGAPDWCGGVDLDQDTVVNFVDFTLFDGCCIEVIRQ